MWPEYYLSSYRISNWKIWSSFYSYSISTKCQDHDLDILFCLKWNFIPEISFAIPVAANTGWRVTWCWLPLLASAKSCVCLTKAASLQSILPLPTTPVAFAQRSFPSAAGHKTSFLTTSSSQLTVFLGQWPNFSPFYRHNHTNAYDNEED